MPSTDRLTTLDSAFLALDTARAPLHVGWTMRFDGAAPSLARLRRHLDARIAHVPRFRRRIAAPALGIGDWHWVDDPGFDIARHVHALEVPAPGGSGELRVLAGRLLSTPLDPARPLWRLYLVGGLRDGFALVGQAHHALVDGIAAIEVAMLLFGPDADAPPAAWRPRERPTRARSARNALSGRAGAVTRALRAAPAAVPGRDVVGAADELRRPSAGTVLQSAATHRRAVGFARTPLDGARTAGRRHQATVNDVLLAACALALGRRLRRSGEAADAIKVLVPVSVRDRESAGELGNRISMLAVRLPVGDTDPVTTLRAVRDETTARKHAGPGDPLAGALLVADALPTRATMALARAAASRAAFATVISNVPGPPVELELLGRPLRELYPSVPIYDGHALTIGAVSYAGTINVGLTADADVLGDVVDLARDVEAGLDALRVEAPRAPTPWRARARARRGHRVEHR